MLYAYKCGTDLIKKKPFKISNDKVNNNNRRRLSDEFTPIRIMVDYTSLSLRLDDSKLTFFKQVFSDVTKYFNSLLSVQHDNVALDANTINDNCGIDEIGSGFERWLYDNDVIIFPYIDDEFDDNVLAAASACLILNDNKPVGGIVGINPSLSNDKIDSKIFIEMILMHELSHVLGFHPFFFEALNLITKETIDNKEYVYINSEKVLEKAKIHFNCSEIKGIQLEDQGGEGSIRSHWEARYMLSDYMISTDYTEMVISDITLALFEDTGFYKVNYYTGGLFRFGKNQGCSFLQEQCIKSEGNYIKTSFPNEFCFETRNPFCGSSHTSRGICSISTYTEPIEAKYQYFSDSHIGGSFSSVNYCPVSYFSMFGDSNNMQYNYPNHCNYGYNMNSYYDEIIGGNSLCFESSLVPSNQNENGERSICYKYECDKFKKEIIVKIGTNKVICPGERKELINPDGFKGKIMCPEYNLVCSSEIQCNSMFDCINKKSTSIRNTYFYLFSFGLKVNLYFLYLIFILYLL